MLELEFRPLKKSGVQYRKFWAKEIYGNKRGDSFDKLPRTLPHGHTPSLSKALLVSYNERLSIKSKNAEAEAEAVWIRSI